MYLSLKEVTFRQYLGRVFDDALRGDKDAMSYVIRTLKEHELWPMVKTESGKYAAVKSLKAPEVLKLIRKFQ